MKNRLNANLPKNASTESDQARFLLEVSLPTGLQTGTGQKARSLMKPLLSRDGSSLWSRLADWSWFDRTWLRNWSRKWWSPGKRSWQL